MNDEIVREVLVKVEGLVADLKLMSIVDLQDLLKDMDINFDNYSREQLIDMIIKTKLTVSEYEIYLKYSNFYHLQKEKEYEEFVGEMNAHISTVLNLYDERQGILRARQEVSRKSDEVKGKVRCLPWIRLKIEYDYVKAMHGAFVSAMAHGTVLASKIKDRIEKIEESGALARFRDRKKVDDLRQRLLKRNKKNSLDRESSYRRYQEHSVRYSLLVEEIIVEALDDPILFSSCKESCSKFYGIDINACGDKLEQRKKMVKLFLEYVNIQQAKYKDNAGSCMEEDVMPAIYEMQDVSADLYSKYFLEFLNKPLEYELDKCYFNAQSILFKIRGELEVQKKCINDVSVQNDVNFALASDISSEEHEIFTLIYKENKLKQ